MRKLIRRVDRHPGLLTVTEWLRRSLPGDSSYGDPLSVGGAGASSVVGRQLTTVAAQQPSVLREIGLGALQVWQAHADSHPGDEGERKMAVLFTDLAGFSTWTLEVGDDLAVRMLREVGAAVEPLVRQRGHVVKWLGDGLMAVFDDADDAVAAAIAAKDATSAVDVAGHRLHLRAGVHVGTPRRLGDDYYGQDVNIAARVAAAAGPGEVLISNTVRQNLNGRQIRLRRRGRFEAKGVPDDVRVWSATGA
ncbi:adenylate/guanylate cyclase domain-containing protein [Halopolyspora algeriensis]|nr:adenylate/guanylate cyclase domain-containing protein [Halopolyspora algeriensis]